MERTFRLYGALLAISGALTLAMRSMLFTDGMLVYTLDDPYIHLSVAETILSGGYGVNDGEYASPSSSILYPLLLAGLLALGLGTWAPIAIALVASAWAAWIMSGLLWQHGVRDEAPGARIFAYAALPLALLAVNAYALPLTGMEHSLHVLTVAFVMKGLFDLSREKPAPASLVAGLVLGPLVRFEALALCGAGLLVLLWYRRYGAAVLTIAVLMVAFGVYFRVMTGLGLPPLPSSVMVKSGLSSAVVDGSDAGFLLGILERLREAIRHGRGALLALAAAAFLFALAARTGGEEKRLAVAFVAVAAIGAHIVAGHYGWFSRYEIYIVALALIAAAFLFGPWLRAGWDRPAFGYAGLVATLAIVATPYAWTTWQTPLASANIYVQQYQMHRFATEFLPRPVALNDLGYVSFRNPIYVLDLWGLGSEDARKRRADPDFGPDDIRALASERDIAYAMVYDDWLGEAIPEEWCRIAELQTIAISAGSGRVAFYAVDPDIEGEMRVQLRAFAATLPDGAKLSLSDCP